jgi:hypothetical protein
MVNPLTLNPALNDIQLSEGLAALIAGYSDDRIRGSPAIQSVSAFLTGSLFQNRSRQHTVSSHKKKASAAFIFI